MVNKQIFRLTRSGPEWTRLGPKVAGCTLSVPTIIHGFTATHKLLTLGTMYTESEAGSPFRRMLVLTAGPGQANRLAEQLASLLGPDAVSLFPSREVWPHEELHVGEDISGARMAALQRLVAGRSGFVIAPIQAAVERLIPRDEFQQSMQTLTVGQVQPMSDVVARLVATGYERVDMVEGRGQFSVRGGLLDVFPVAAPAPVRIDYFDDEIDALRLFDPATQRSTDTVDEVHIGPARELLAGADADTLRAIGDAATEQAAALKKADRPAEADNLLQRVETHLDHLEAGRWVPGLEQYKPFMFSRLHTLLDYVEGGAVVVDEPMRTREQLHLFLTDFAEGHAELLQRGRVLPAQQRLFADWDDTVVALRGKRAVFMAGLQEKVPGVEEARHVEVKSRLPDVFHGNMERFVAAVRRHRRAGARIVIVASTETRAERLRELLTDEEIPVVDVAAAADAPRGTAIIVVGDVRAGCEIPGANLVVFTETEVFGHQRRRQRTRRRTGAPVRMDDLKAGDLVVHVNHGIGRYKGVETLTISGAQKDYLLVHYAGDDKLYVPTDQVDLLQKYVGVEGQTPRLNKLGGNEWTRAKQRVQESVRELAQGLLKLYAERQALPGYAFAPDSLWQQQFEEAFPYEETPDQWRAIEEIKADMEKPQPMDRLLCGDVGFGKTEVAMRAAFKTVTDAKQVAVLVPTTILAQQHLRTFRERFKQYPMRIKAVSRFQTNAEVNRIMKGLADGTVDIVIGTHRLLSKDMGFKNLGLVIVDEEQRFGVAQKERLKELRRTVDVLTLTATPIPRTLHMAVVGVRDMSVIETPPEDRFPIRTYVAEYDEQLTREAILREMGRGGQVYVVHNRVQDIERFGEKLRKLVPEARIAVAHGQMPEEALERVMLDFLDREYDVLLCTTIIETGMDIANVNTLIVNEADRLGLAQLYQLRGRVGRSNRVAYAYFTYRRDKILSEDAEKRLQAIKEFTELGSGFKIAMRDLEIRGAGNLLGSEQSGFIASIGFELYAKLLEEAVREVKGDVVLERPEPVIDLSVDAYVSDKYVGDARRKIEVYKKVAGIRTVAEAADLQEELEDRFGPIPPPVRNLLAVARIKVLAKDVGVASINGTEEQILIRMPSGVSLPRETALQLSRRFRGRILLSAARAAPVKLRRKGLGERDVLTLLGQVLEEMRATWPSGGNEQPRSDAQMAHTGGR